MRVVIGLGLGLVLLSLACSNDTSSGSAAQSVSCDQDPWVCPSGSTCWTVDGKTAACVTSGSGQVGDPCVPQAGKAPCGDGLVCLRLAGWSSGECTPYCDSSHACPANESCVMVGVQGSTISYSACVPATGPDAGVRD